MCCASTVLINMPQTLTSQLVYTARVLQYIQTSQPVYMMRMQAENPDETTNEPVAEAAPQVRG
jgi:hypothetical protein